MTPKIARRLMRRNEHKLALYRVRGAKAPAWLDRLWRKATSVLLKEE